MKLLRTASVLVLSAFVLSACDEDPVGIVIADLAGMWNATQFEYTDNAIPSFSIDAISDAGGAVSLDVAESGAFTGTIMIPGLTVNPATGETITVDIGGTLSIDGDILTVDFNAATEALGLFGDFDATFELSGDVLTFVNDDTSFDFPDAIEEQAGIGAREAVPATLSTRFTR
jgi:hypothetical protein